MAYEHKDGSGAMFKADKGDNPARPDYRGDFMLDGVVYEISGWIKPKVNNPAERFMSLSIKPKQERQAAPKAAPKPQQRQERQAEREDLDSDIPFANPLRGVRALVQ
jgi:hypothetical protein